MLALKCGAFFAACKWAVRYRAYHESFFAAAGCVHIESGALHLDRKHAHFLPHGKARRVVIEGVGGIEIADKRLDSELLGGGNGFGEGAVIRYRSEITRQAILAGIGGIRAGTHAEYDVTQVKLGAYCARRADANYCIYIVKIEKLI